MSSIKNTIYATVGFVGFSGIVLIFGTLSKPWVTISFQQVSFKLDEYSQIHLQNTSENMNSRASIKIKLPKDTKSEDLDLGKNTKNLVSFDGDTSSLNIDLGADQYVSLSCKHCNLDKNSFINLSSDKFSLRYCSVDDLQCKYRSKKDFYIGRGLIGLWIVFLVFSFYFLFKKKTSSETD